MTATKYQFSPADAPGNLTTRLSETLRLVHVTTVPLTLRFLGGHVQYAKRHGLAVEVISSPGEDLEAFGQKYQVPVYAIPMTRQITPLIDLQSLYRLIRRISVLKPAIVHAHTPKAGLLAMLAARICGVPVRIFHMHGLPHVTARGLRRIAAAFSTAAACRLATRVFVVSPSIRALAIAERFCRPDDIMVPANGSIAGVDTLEFNVDRAPRISAELRYSLGIPESAFTFGFAGRIAGDKGIGELAEAWSLAAGEDRNLHLVIAGSLEPNDPPSPHVLAELQGDERVHFLGWVSDMAAFLALLDVLVLPSYREGLPVVLIEAGAMAVPVIATDIPGCRDVVVDGVTGTLVPPRDAKRLADALLQYIHDPDRAARHGQAGRQRAIEVFQPEAIFAATLAEYVRLLQTIGISVPDAAMAGGD